MSKLNYYKQYAKRCLLSGRTNSRAFDNCFEDGYGKEVVIFLMEQATDLPLFPELPATPFRYCTYVASKKQEARLLLRQAIKRSGNWEYWMYFMKHGTYEGFYIEQ